MGIITAAAVGVASSVIGGAVTAGKQHREMRRQRSLKREAKYKMEQAILDRQEITNPYAGVTDLSGLASDLSSQITNPFNSLTVSTAAAEMQAEEADIALANTLDTLEQTGASAGGATALAMAALKSKQQVSASIEQQEAKNAELKARGEQAAQQQRVAATTRFQNVQIEQGQRVQDADIAGEIFQYQAQEARTNADINMYNSMYQGFAANQAQASMASAASTNQI
ncbi:unnamed protein product, partial [marine sediment metagenome]